MRLTLPQAKKLMKGGIIQVKPEALDSNMHWLILEKKMANKVRKAKKAGKGCRIHLSPSEMECCGEGFAEFWQGLKDAGNWVKKNIIDSSVYQSAIKPIVRSAVDTGLTAVAPKLGIAAPAAKAAVDELGRQTGAYGLKEEFAKAKNLYQKHAKKYVAPHLRKAVQSAEKALVSRAKKMAPQFASDIDRLHEEYGEKAITELGKFTGAYGMRKGRGLQTDYSFLLAPTNPAMHPVAANLPPIGGGGWVYMTPDMLQGGSFKVAGAGRRRKRGGSFMPSG